MRFQEYAGLTVREVNTASSGLVRQLVARGRDPRAVQLDLQDASLRVRPNLPGGARRLLNRVVLRFHGGGPDADRLVAGRPNPTGFLAIPARAHAVMGA